jgi:uncharacterized protein (DUF169 family)
LSRFTSIPISARGRYEAVALAPLVYGPFDPDIVLICAHPAQMMLLINALQAEEVWKEMKKAQGARRKG